MSDLRLPERLTRMRETRLRGSAAWIPTVVRVATGGFFVAVGLAKFFDHTKEVREFRSFDVPWPEVAVPAIGTLEVVAGALLIAGLLTRLAALALAFDMIGAIATAGRVEGGAFHLGVAPAMLVLMLFLVWAGPGRASIDDRALAGGMGLTEATQ